METEHTPQQSETNGAGGRGLFEGEEYVVPGVPIVRTSTLRPLALGGSPSSTAGSSQQTPALTHEALSTFPVEAPSAPPLPEEYGEDTQESAATSGGRSVSAPAATPLPLADNTETPEDTPPEFVWLFEYALEMDSSILNSSVELHDLALQYGPAVLKGYKLAFDVLNAPQGEVVATIVPSRERGAAVWGVLYRVPRRLLERIDSKPTPLDIIHFATPPNGLFERLQVVVHEVYRQRDVTCFTYIASATARNLFHLQPLKRQAIDSSYLERLLETARKQQLPNDYLQELLALAQTETPATTLQIAEQPSIVEQNTEPLQVLAEQTSTGTAVNGLPSTPPALLSVNRGHLAFALYLAGLLLAVLALAVLQGLGIGTSLFIANFTSLGIPWFVLFYGLIGGCVSCIVRLSRRTAAAPANFVLITWFTRPFIGAVLAIVVYLLLNSGGFVLGENSAQRAVLFALLALLAGASEGWLF